ncbi:MAG: hypothetical protein IJS94_03900, partial [Clostridia bacterium]|nr:hypothetical protein [Clostridia bacterium]
MVYSDSQSITTQIVPDSNGATIDLYARWLCYYDVNGFKNDGIESFSGGAGNPSTFSFTIGGSTENNLSDKYGNVLDKTAFTVSNISVSTGYQFVGYSIIKCGNRYEDMEYSTAYDAMTSALNATSFSETVDGYTPIYLMFETLYTVSYDLNGGTGTATGGTYRWGQSFTTASAPSLEGY